MELCCPLGILTGNSASWNTRENRCHLQQNSTHSLGTYPFSRRLLILAMWSAAGSSATDACREESFWKPDTGVNLICSLALGRWIGGTGRGSSAADCPLGITSGNGELLPLEAVSERSTMCTWKYLHYYFIELSIRSGPCGWICQSRDI